MTLTDSQIMSTLAQPAPAAQTDAAPSRMDEVVEDVDRFDMRDHNDQTGWR